MIQVIDVTGTRLRIDRPPQRVVSLVPSTTETVFALGAGDTLVGITRFCVHPPEAGERIRHVGGTKTPRIEVVRELKPELVLANKEENRERDIALLRHFAPVYVAFPRDVPSAIEEIGRLGMLLGRESASGAIVSRLTAAWERLRVHARLRRSLRFLYLIWRHPYMAAGPGTFIDALCREAGWENALAQAGVRYPELSTEEIADAGADVILLSSEPYPFGQEHAEELQTALSIEGREPPRTLLVDGAALSWHGIRMEQGLAYLDDLANRLDKAETPPPPLSGPGVLK